MARLSTRLAAVLAGMFVALASPVPPEASADPAAVDDALACPAAFVGAAVATRAVPRGVEIVFTSATSAQVAGMRTRLRELAAVLRQRSRLALASRAPDPGPVPPVAVTLKDAALGTRITVKALRVADVELLQALGAALEDAWAVSPCGLGPSMRMPRSGRDLVATSDAGSAARG